MNVVYADICCKKCKLSLEDFKYSQYNLEDAPVRNVDLRGLKVYSNKLEQEFRELEWLRVLYPNASATTSLDRSAYVELDSYAVLRSSHWQKMFMHEIEDKKCLLTHDVLRSGKGYKPLW